MNGAWLILCVLVPATQPKDLGPDVVVLEELQSLYEPVPFDHRTHAAMADTFSGCETCHHRKPVWRGAESNLVIHPTQEDASTTPKCKSCHPIAEQAASIKMPNLKGAYHRQCLNCHKEWMHDNACVICHKPRDPKKTTALPTVDDIAGRMHPPIPEPDSKLYRARFTPAVGSNVLFRHKEHTQNYGLRCAHCHQKDTCGNCHDGQTHLATPPIKPGRTWKDSHAPCVGCHVQDQCRRCHYKEGDPAPAPFNHASTGQALDKDHASLKCGQCHAFLRQRQDLSCGTSDCHKRRDIAFPKDRPGPFTPKPVIARKPPVTRPSLQATTRPLIGQGGGT